MNDILKRLKGKLIVSCQALDDEPLHGSLFMARMAAAACLGGASGIRANTVADIRAIQKDVGVPIIGIIKKVYPDSGVYITPTMDEVDALVEANADIIAMDATGRARPFGKTLDEFFPEVRGKYPDQLFMADASCFEEGLKARDLGFDIIGTTLAGYTDYTAGRALPDIELMKRLARHIGLPIFAEGGIRSPEQLKQVMETGVFAAVVGSAITRPDFITKMYADVLKKDI